MLWRCLVPDRGLDALAPAVEIAELHGQRGRLRRVVGHQQSRRHGGAVQPAGGVEPRREREADDRGGQLLSVYGGLAQHRGNARPGIAADLFQTAPDEIAVFAHQRHDVRDRADRGEIAVALDHLAAAAFTGADELERNADPRERVVRIALVRTLAVNHGDGLRQGSGAAFVMVGDDHVHPERGGVQRLLARGDAAVHRDDKLDALLAQRRNGGVVETVAFFAAVGDIGDTFQTLAAQIVRQQTGRGDAVHVVVAVYGRFLALFDGAVYALDGKGHIREQHRVFEQLFSAAEHCLHLGAGLHPAQGQHRGEQRRTAAGEKLGRDDGPLEGDLPFLSYHKHGTCYSIFLLITYHIKVFQFFQ